MVNYLKHVLDHLYVSQPNVVFYLTLKLEFVFIFGGAK